MRRHERYVREHPGEGVAVFKYGGRYYQTVGDPTDTSADIFLAKDERWKTTGVVQLYNGKPQWESWPGYFVEKPNKANAEALLAAGQAAYRQKFPGTGFDGGQIDAAKRYAEANKAKQAEQAEQAKQAEQAEQGNNAANARQRAARKRQLAEVAPGLLARKQREAEAAQEELMAAIADGDQLAQYDAVQAAEVAVAANNALDEFADSIDSYLAANPGMLEAEVIESLPAAYRGLFAFIFQQLAEAPDNEG